VKTAALCLAIALVAGLVSFGLTRWIAASSAPADEMAWLRQEFALTPAQSEAIERLHADYRPVCAEHCARIMEARERLVALERAGGPDTAAHAAAAAEMAQLIRTCTESTRRHLEAVAALMSPDQGRRYLELVGAKVAQHSHAEPFGLR